MNAAGLVTEPPGVSTIMTAVPGAPTGVVAVIVMSSTTERLDTSAPPTETAVAPVKPVPVIVIAVPPKSGPLTGNTLAIAGIGAYL